MMINVALGLTSSRLNSVTLPLIRNLANCRNFLSANLLTAILLSLAPCTAADTSQQVQLEKLKRTIANLENRLDSQRDEKNNLQQQLKDIELNASRVNIRIRQLRHQTAANENQLRTLTSKKQVLQENIKQQSSAIAEQIRATHKIGTGEPVKLFLNQEDPQQLARVFKYYDYLLQARSEKIQQFEADIEQLTTLVENINKTKIALAKSKKTLETERTVLANTTVERKKMLLQLDATVQSGAEKLSRLQRQRTELEELVSAVEVAVTDIIAPQDYPSFASSKGKLAWPVKGSVVQNFGSRRTGQLRWEGWLIDVNAGSTVTAVHWGRVVFSNYLRGFGLLIIVDHNDGYMSLYAHNQELLRDTGDWVQSGEAVSRAGDTGGLLSPAVYFEIRRNGAPVNPKNWLQKG
jgi:septal ring factor EnvC (AmiA/AmiB activator)